MSTNAKDSLSTIEDFVDEVGAVKSAEANTEAGGFDGPTTHAVKDVEDGTENAEEGARSSENTKDIKDPDIGPGQPSVDATAEATAKVGAAEGTAAGDHLQIGTNVQATGDDPSNETSGTKNTKDDDGYEGASAHPARTDNSEIDGHKYASDNALATMPLEKLAEYVGDLGNQVCADLATSATTAKQAMAMCPGCGKPSKSCSCGTPGSDKSAAEAIRPELAQQVGWEMAGLVTGDFDKQAADSLVHSTLKDVIKTASDDADNVASYMHEFLTAKQAEYEKAAMGEPSPMGGMPGGDPGGQLPPEAMGAAPGGAPGGEDPMAALMGPGAEGGMPPGAEGGMPGAEGGEPDPEQLAQVLDQLGISPEELQAALAGEAGGDEMGGMGGAPEGGDPLAAMGGAPGGDPMGAPGGAEMPPEAGAMEAQASATTEEKKAHLTNYVQEVVTRSRQKKASAVSRAAAAIPAGGLS